MTAPAATPRPASKPSRTVESVLAHAHLRLGALSLARVELETMAGLGLLDSRGLVDLAEVRWRTGDLLGAGEAANAALREEDGAVIALVIAAEAASAVGRPSEARRMANRVLAGAPAMVDRIFAGMPRSSVWPGDSAEPPPTAPTLFDREPDLPPRVDGYASRVRGSGRHRAGQGAVDGGTGHARLLGWRGRRRARGHVRPGCGGRAGRGPLRVGRRRARPGGAPLRAGVARRTGPRAGRPRGDRGCPQRRHLDGPRRRLPARRPRDVGPPGLRRGCQGRSAGAPRASAQEGRSDGRQPGGRGPDRARRRAGRVPGPGRGRRADARAGSGRDRRSRRGGGRHRRR